MESLWPEQDRQITWIYVKAYRHRLMLNYWLGGNNPVSSVQRQRLSHQPSPQPKAASIQAHYKQVEMGLS